MGCFEDDGLGCWSSGDSWDESNLDVTLRADGVREVRPRQAGKTVAMVFKYEGDATICLAKSVVDEIDKAIRLRASYELNEEDVAKIGLSLEELI